MPQPHGSLTEAQLEIMKIIWGREKTGATVAEIWQAWPRTETWPARRC